MCFPQHRSFSEYKDNTKQGVTDKNIDHFQDPVGLSIIKSTVDTLAQRKYGNLTRENLNKLLLLDGACGTGNYIQLLLNHGIGKIYGIESNPSLFEQCEFKHSENLNNGSLKLNRGPLMSFDFSKGFNFDAIMMNQILHKLDNNETRANNFSNIRQLLNKFYQNLNKNGCLIINTSLNEQLQPGLWYHEYIPNASENMMKKLPSKEFFETELFNAGFTDMEQYTITQPLMTFEEYYNFDGIKDSQWRQCDLTFEECSEEELNHAIKLIENDIINKIKDNEIEKTKLIQTFETNRKTVGHSTSFVAWKK